MKIEKTYSTQPSAPSSTARQQQAEKLREVASMYEKQFLREMVKSMRKTVDDSGLTEKGLGSEIYNEQLDSEYVEQWGKQGGVGLADLIFQQLAEKYLPEPKLKQIAPLTLPGQGERQGKSFKVDQLPPQDLQSPLPGKVESLKSLEGGGVSVIIDHLDGLKSELRTKTSEVNLASTHVEANQPFLKPGPLLKDLEWSVSWTGQALGQS